jgi:hypothetical protein
MSTVIINPTKPALTSLNIRILPSIVLNTPAQYKRPGVYQAYRQTVARAVVGFGGLAIVNVETTFLDPELCVPGFRRVCYYRSIVDLLLV